MARKQIEHQCERCGKTRLVSPDKIAKGKQRYCRQCQGPVAAHKRREAMLKRGGPRHVTYQACKECGYIYEMASIGDGGCCGDKCATKVQARGYSSQTIKRKLNALWKPTTSQALKEVI